MIKAIDGNDDPLVELVLVDTTHPSEDKYIDQELLQVRNNITKYFHIFTVNCFRTEELKRPD